MKFTTFIIAIILFILSNSCSEDLPYYKTNLASCINENAWDSLSITQHLAGKWNWDYVSCFWGYESGEDNQGLALEFLSDGQVIVLQNNIPSDTSNWRVTSGPAYKLSINPPVDQTRGYIYFCDDHVIFDETDIDLCANYFTRN